MLAALSQIDFTVVFAFVLGAAGFLYAHRSNLKGSGISALAHSLADQAVEHALMGATGILDGITPQNAADKLDAWVWAELAKHGVAKNDAIDLLVKPAIADAAARVLAALRGKLAAEGTGAIAPEPFVARKLQSGFARLAVMLLIISLGLFALGSMVACSWGRAEEKSVIGDVVDCTKANAANAIKEFAPLADQFLLYATGANGVISSDAVASAAKSFGKQVGGCVLADAVARALKPAATGSDAPKSSELVIDPGSLRRALATAIPATHFHTANGDL